MNSTCPHSCIFHHLQWCAHWHISYCLRGQLLTHRRHLHWRNLPRGYGKWCLGTPTSPLLLQLSKDRQMHIYFTVNCSITQATSLHLPPPYYQIFNICRNPDINETLEHALNSSALPIPADPFVIKHNAVMKRAEMGTFAAQIHMSAPLCLDAL